MCVSLPFSLPYLVEKKTLTRPRSRRLTEPRLCETLSSCSDLRRGGRLGGRSWEGNQEELQDGVSTARMLPQITTHQVCGTRHPGLICVSPCLASATSAIAFPPKNGPHYFSLARSLHKSERSQLWWSPGSPSHLEGVVSCSFWA